VATRIIRRLSYESKILWRDLLPYIYKVFASFIYGYAQCPAFILKHIEREMSIIKGVM